MQYSPVSEQPELDCLEQQALPKMLVTTTTSVITSFLQLFQEPHISTWVEARLKTLFTILYHHLTLEEKELVFYILQLSTSKVLVAHTGTQAKGWQTCFLRLPSFQQYMQHKKHLSPHFITAIAAEDKVKREIVLFTLRRKACTQSSNTENSMS